jgi:membrane protein
MVNAAQGSKPGLKQRLTARMAGLRMDHPVLDHLLATFQHYTKVQGNVLAGAVTYFGFLSFFPILAIGFAAVGYLSGIYPDARDNLASAIQQLFPGIVTNHPAPGKISLDQIEAAKIEAGLIGLALLLYSGLGWLSGLREALQNTFEVPKEEKRSFVVGKAFDLVVLCAVGFVMIVSVGISGVVAGLADTILDWVGIGGGPAGRALLWLIGPALGVAASTVLFFVMFKLLPKPDLPRKAMWRGALFAAVGFELLKLIVVNILGHVGGTSFAPLALAVTLLVWINYFSRLVMYGASWAMTAPESVAWRAGAAADAARPAQFRSSVVAQSATRQIEPTTSEPVSPSGPARTTRGADRVSVAAGAVVGAAATAAAFSASAVRRRLAGTVGRRR